MHVVRSIKHHEIWRERKSLTHMKVLGRNISFMAAIVFIEERSCSAACAILLETVAKAIVALVSR